MCWCWTSVIIGCSILLPTATASIFLKRINIHVCYNIFFVITESSSTVFLLSTTNRVGASLDDHVTVSIIIAIVIIGIAIAIGVILTLIFTKLLEKPKKNGKVLLPPETPRQKKPETYIREYKEFLTKDPRIVNIHLPNMHRNMDITSIYIKSKLYHEEGPTSDIPVKEKYNSKEIFQSSQKRIHNKALTAHDAEIAISTCRSQHCVVLGDPGSGKTTLLKHLAMQSAFGQLAKLPSLPLYIELNAFANSGKNDLLDFASSEWEQNYNIPKDIAHKCITEKLKRGEILLLLDGLDETIIGETTKYSEESYTRISNIIAQIAILYHKSPIVVTVRKAGYLQRNRLAGFTEMDILAFQLEDIKKFVNSWFAYHSSRNSRDDARELNYIFERNIRIQMLATNPLLLSLICIVYEKRNKDLPHERAKLYEYCVNILLNEWDATRKIFRRRQFSLEHKKHLLEEVAWHFHIQGRHSFPRDELLNVIENFLPTINRLEDGEKERILNEITNENGLLKEHAPELYSFLHLTIQEYFVALQISDPDLKRLDTLLKHSDESWWEEVVFLYAGNTHDASLLIEKLLQQDTRMPVANDIFYTNLMLAGRCIAARATIRQLGRRKEVIDSLFNLLEHASYSLLKNQVLEILVEIGSTDIEKRLLALLTNNKFDGSIRQKIATALGKSQTSNQLLVSHLKEMLYDTKVDKAIRQCIAYTLGKLDDDTFVNELFTMVKTENPKIELDVRESIVDAIGILGTSGKLTGKPAVSLMFKLLSDEKVNECIRGRVADAIGNLDDQTVVSKLVELLSKESNSYVGMRIAAAIGKLGGRFVIHELLQILRNAKINANVRMSIADALGHLGDSTVSEKLWQMLPNISQEPKVQSHIITSIGMIGEKNAAPKLSQLLHDPDQDTLVRQSAANALSKLGDSSITSDLFQLLVQEQDQEICISIIDALGTLGDRTVALDLENLFSNLSFKPEVHEVLADTLGKLGEKSIIPNLLDHVQDQTIALNTRVHIAGALGTLGEKSITPLLVDMLFNEKLDPDIRSLIVDTVGMLGDVSQAHRLITLLSDTTIEKNVRRHSANALAQIADDETTILELAQLLQSSDIADDIYHSLWILSHKTGVRIFLKEEQGKKYPVVIKWGVDPFPTNHDRQANMFTFESKITTDKQETIFTMQNNNLRLIDIFVHEEEKNPVLDITLYNQGNQTVLPTRAKIEVLDVGEFYDCDDGQTRSFISVTSSYGVVLSPSLRGQEQVIQISHLLRPEESDRFQLVISQSMDNPGPIYVWYTLKVTIVYDEQAHNITSQPLLISIPPVNPGNHAIWEEGYDSCIAQNKATLSRMASQAANRSRSVEAAIQAYQPNPPKSEGKRSPTSSPDGNRPVSQATTASITDPIEIFFSYAKEDESLVEKLDKQLAVSKRRNLLTNWHTGKIALGKNVKQEILHHLQQAHIILLLITTGFIASPQYGIIDDALKQGNVHKKAIIIPVLLRPTADLQSTFFGELSILPRNGKAIMAWRQQDEAFAQVAEEIVEIVKSLKQQKDS